MLNYVKSLERQNAAMRLEIEQLKGNMVGGSMESPVVRAAQSPTPPVKAPQPPSAPETPADPPARPTPTVKPSPTPISNVPRPEGRAFGFEGDPCPNCHAMMLVRNGSCFKCHSCGETTGCS